MGIAAGKRRRTLLVGTAVAIGGALAGAIAAASAPASAGTTGAGASAATAAVSSPSASAPSGPGGQWHGEMASTGQQPAGFGLNLTGTVTAVGTSTVTIKTSSGAIKTYTINASSDIDKNGEAQLSSLAVGDAVRYSVRTGTSTIDKLHAGDEAKDAPAHGTPPGSSHGAPPNSGQGMPPNSSQATTPSSKSSA